MRTIMAFVVAVSWALGARAVTAAEKPTIQEVQNRTIFRKPYDVARDARGNMHLDPLPFTKALPAGAPNIDVYPAVGYKGDVSLEDPKTAVWGVNALGAGLCREGEKCDFSFVYVISIQKSYAAEKPDDVGIRYFITQGGHSTEGLIWGTQNSNQRFLRDKNAWRAATDPERMQMWNAVTACSTFHEAQVAAVQGP